MSSSKIVPTYQGYIFSTKDALVVIQAALNKQLPTVPRRPHDKERASLIKSGNVFVFIEERSGVKRWTDGVSWSPSRILGRFLVYRELDRSAAEKESKKKVKKESKRKSLNSPTASSFSPGHSNNNLSISSASSLSGASAPNPPLGDQGADSMNRSLVGSLVASYAFREKGLVKKTLSLTVTRPNTMTGYGVDGHSASVTETIHLISYYNTTDVMDNVLTKPTYDPQLKDVQVTPELYQALHDTSLGGKTPHDDEPLYPVDASQTAPANMNGLNIQTASGAAPQVLYFQPQQPQVYHGYVPPANGGGALTYLPPLNSHADYSYSSTGTALQFASNPSSAPPATGQFPQFSGQYFNPITNNNNYGSKYAGNNYATQSPNANSNAVLQNQYYSPQPASVGTNSSKNQILPNLSGENQPVKLELSPVVANASAKPYPQPQQKFAPNNYLPSYGFPPAPQQPVYNKPATTGYSVKQGNQYYGQGNTLNSPLGYQSSGQLQPQATNTIAGGSQTPTIHPQQSYGANSNVGKWFYNGNNNVQPLGQLDDGSNFLNQNYSTNGLYQSN